MTLETLQNSERATFLKSEPRKHHSSMSLEGQKQKNWDWNVIQNPSSEFIICTFLLNFPVSENAWEKKISNRIIF